LTEPASQVSISVAPSETGHAHLFRMVPASFSEKKERKALVRQLHPKPSTQQFTHPVTTSNSLLCNFSPDSGATRSTVDDMMPFVEIHAIKESRRKPVI